MRTKTGEVIFLWPLALHVLTAGYYYSDGSSHEAIDLRTNQGGSIVKPVYAVEDGTVDQTQTWDGHTKTGMQSYGTMVRIRHADYCGQTLQTRYAHLSRLCVTKGQKVKAGQLIGYTGQTGYVKGGHLHFEVILGGSRRNPLVWLDDDFTTANSNVYTYRPGEHAAVLPAEPEAPAYVPARLQTITIGPVTQGDADAILAVCKARELDDLGLYISKWSNNAHTLQTITIGPVTQGDADAILAVCKARQLDKLGLYTSVWADEEEEAA